MTVWADKQGGPAGPFEGVLILMNMGQDDLATSPMDSEYGIGLASAIAEAHAKGRLVLYVFDRGMSPPPEYFDVIEGMDHLRLMAQACGRDVASFPYDAQARLWEFREMAAAAFSQKDFKFTGHAASIAGKCEIHGMQAFVPPTKLGE